MSKNKHKLWVYGSYRSGHGNNRILRMYGAELLGPANYTSGHSMLLDLGGFPGLVPSKEGPEIRGELWAVSRACLSDLDKLEPNDEYFWRRKIRVELGVDSSWVEVRAWGYFLREPKKWEKATAIEDDGYADWSGYLAGKLYKHLSVIDAPLPKSAQWDPTKVIEIIPKPVPKPPESAGKIIVIGEHTPGFKVNSSGKLEDKGKDWTKGVGSRTGSTSLLVGLSDLEEGEERDIMTPKGTILTYTRKNGVLRTVKWQLIEEGKPRPQPKGGCWGRCAYCKQAVFYTAGAGWIDDESYDMICNMSADDLHSPFLHEAGNGGPESCGQDQTCSLPEKSAYESAQVLFTPEELAQTKRTEN